MADEHGVPPGWVEHLAEVLHDAYEAEAARAGWETNPHSRVPWKDVPEPNKVATRAGVRAVLTDLFVEGAKRGVR